MDFDLKGVTLYKIRGWYGDSFFSLVDYLVFYSMN